MPGDLKEISKKELLEVTGISYGQLYRWKRKGLIPEAWFVKRAAFTGQETFFPRTEILERVERIQGLKEEINLDQLADLLSPRPSSLRLSAEQALVKNIVSGPGLELLARTLGPEDPLDFDQLLLGRIVGGLLDAGDLGLEEGALLLRALAAWAHPGQGRAWMLRKHGVGFCFLALGEASPDPEAKVLARIDLPARAAELKLVLEGGKA